MIDSEQRRFSRCSPFFRCSAARPEGRAAEQRKKGEMVVCEPRY
jgi:hypothetical protein